MRSSCRVLGLVLVFTVHGATAQPIPTDRDRSATLNRQAELAYEEGDFRAAAQLLDLAYAAYPEPAILYNIGRTRERLGDTRAAISSYRRYLDAAPDAADRGEVMELLARLEAKAKTQPEAPPRIEPIPRPEPPVALRRRASKVPWLVVGTGGAIAGGGVVFGYLTVRANDRAETAASQAAAARYVERAERDEKLQLVGLIGGGALIAGGVIWAVLEWRAARNDTTQWSMAIGPSSIAAALAF